MIHSPAPWNAAVALCRLDLHALVRGIEAEWRVEIGIPVRPRGGSDANTREALRALERLAPAVTEATAISAARKLSRWTRTAQLILGDAERPRRLPEVLGSGDAICPACARKSLRMWAMTGIVRCVSPGCCAEAQVEYAEAEGRIMLIWRTGDAA